MATTDQKTALPASVTVLFPRTDDGAPADTPTAYEIHIDTAAPPGLADDPAGFDGTRVLRSGVVATWSGGSSATNDAELQALAERIAHDWYAWQMAPLDAVYHGPAIWEPDGGHDLIFDHGAGTFQTRVCRGPWLDHLDQAGFLAAVETPANSTVNVKGGTTAIASFTASTIDFDPTYTTITESPTGEANVALQVASATTGGVLTKAAQTITGRKKFSVNPDNPYDVGVDSEGSIRLTHDGHVGYAYFLHDEATGALEISTGDDSYDHIAEFHMAPGAVPFSHTFVSASAVVAAGKAGLAVGQGGATFPPTGAGPYLSIDRTVDDPTDIYIASAGIYAKYISLDGPAHLFAFDGGGNLYQLTRAAGASALNELSDVTLTSPADGDVLTYDLATSQWINASGGGGGGTGDTSGPSSSVDGEIALFDGTTGKLLKRATGSGGVEATSGVYSTYTLTAAGKALLDDADATAQRTTLGLGTLATLSSVTTTEIAAATLVTESEGIASNDNDTTLPTSAAVKDYVDTAVAAGSGAPVGAIAMYGGSGTPTGWLRCDGSAVSRTTYAALFAVIGTTWGVGDGSTSFNVPNFAGRSPIGQGTGSGLTNRVQGTTGGTETHTLTTAEMPSHTHGPTGAYDGIWQYESSAAATIQGGSNYNASAQSATGATGGDGSHNNMHPWLATSFLIKT